MFLVNGFHAAPFTHLCPPPPPTTLSSSLCFPCPARARDTCRACAQELQTRGENRLCISKYTPVLPRCVTVCTCARVHRCVLTEPQTGAQKQSWKEQTPSFFPSSGFLLPVLLTVRMCHFRAGQGVWGVKPLVWRAHALPLGGSRPRAGAGPPRPPEVHLQAGS